MFWLCSQKATFAALPCQSFLAHIFIRYNPIDFNYLILKYEQNMCLTFPLKSVVLKGLKPLLKHPMVSPTGTFLKNQVNKLYGAQGVHHVSCRKSEYSIYSTLQIYTIKELS